MGEADRASILLVDDDDLFVDAAAEVLRARGYAVQTAGSIRDAKARAQPTSTSCSSTIICLMGADCTSLHR